MPLPVERPCPKNARDKGKVFLISLSRTDYEDGAKVTIEIPRYDLGAFSSSLDAERICNRMNQRLWKLKELEFLTTIAEDTDTEEAESGLEYNDKARETDQQMEYFHVVDLDIRSYSDVAEALPEYVHEELLAS